MAKNTENTATEGAIYKLPAIMETLGTPSLKAIAMVFELNPIRLYSVAKTPKEGEIYDAKQYNWEAIERFCLKRLDPDKGINTLEDVIVAALKLDEDLKLNDKRRTTEAGGSSKLEMIDIDGRQMPVRKFANFEATYEGEKVHPAGVHTLAIKKDDNVYGFVHQTRGFTVLRPVDANGVFCSETVKVISNSLLNLVGIGPTAYTAKFIDEQYAKQAIAATAPASTEDAAE